MAGLSAPDRDRRTVDVAVDRAARVVAVCSVLLLSVFAVLDSRSVASDGAGLLVRLAVFGAAALLQVAAYTAVGGRFARLLLLAVPAAIVADTVMMFQAGRASSLDLGVRTAIVAASLLLVASVRAGAAAAAVVASIYVASLAIVGLMAGAPLPVAELVRAIAEPVSRAGLPMFVFAAAALAALLARHERKARMALVAHARRQEALATVGALALGGMDGDALRVRAVAVAREALGADTIALFQLATDEKTLDIHAGGGWPKDRPGHLDVARHTFARHVLDADAPVVFDDVAADKRFAAPTLLRDYGLVSGAAALVADGGKPSGILAAFSKRRAAFTTEDGAFLAALTRMLAAAMSRLADTRTLAEEARVATALARVGRELISSVDTPIVLERVCQLAAELLHADHSQTWLVDAGEDVFVPIAGHGFAPETWNAIRALRTRTSSMAPMMKRLERDHVIEVTPSAHEHPFLETLLLQFGIGRALVVALHRGTEVIGVQVTGRVGPDPFTPEQAQLAIGVARLASLALANAHLIEDAEHASQLKSEFLSTMSHELRTPLNVIIGYLDMLAEKAGPPEHADILGRVRGSSLELLDMIESTLNLNRIEAGQDIPELGEVSIDDLWDELRGEFAVHPRKTDAVVRWEPVHAATLYSDRRRLKIVLKNLVGNALKFTPEGEVVVRCEQRDRAYVFSVRDTGIGIPASHLPIVFDMFRQVDSSESRSYAGVGLGLYIVKRLLDQLGGTVEVESEVGIGSTFRVTLPNESMPSQGALSARAADAPPLVRPGNTATRDIAAVERNVMQASAIGETAAAEVPRKQRILYADDLELNRQLLRRLIARHLPDVEFHEACNGEHALAVFEAQQPDLVLLDLRMPKMDGWVAARRLRNLEGGRDVPIVAVTVTATPGAEAYALHAGCNEFLAKPISDYSLLLSRIEHWLGRGRPTASPQPQRAPAPRSERAVHLPRAAAPRPEASASDMVCILCNQPLPSPSATIHEKRRDLTAHPLPHA